MMALRRVFLTALLIAALVAPAALASLPATSPAPSRAAAPLAFDPIRTRAPTFIPSPVGTPRPSVASSPSAVAPASAAPAPAVSAASPQILAGWEGLQAIVGGPVPPDPILSVGPNQVVEMVNLQMEVYSKQGALLNLTDLATLFHTGTDFISDPKVQYDPASGRWFATLTDVTTTQVPLVVSRTSDATGPWALFHVPSASTGHCLDQPILGVGTNVVVVSVNVFTQTSPNTCVNPYLGAEYWVINKTDLVKGVTPHAYDSGINSLEGSIHPVQIQGTTPVMYMVSTYWPGTATTSNTLHMFAVSGVPPTTPTVTVTSLSMPTAAVPPSAPQLGTRSTLDTSDIRVMDAVWASGKIWLGFDEACPTDSSRACIRLVQLDAASGTALQDFDINLAGKDVFYPAFRVDGSGNLAVVFGFSSANEYPGIMTTGRVFGDPANTYQTPQHVVAGTGPETSACKQGLCRYGDYFGAARDPSNDSVVWLNGERGTGVGWSTHVFSVSIKAQLILNYTLMGGGSGYSSPVVSFIRGGVAAEASFGTTPTTILADPATAWSVSTSLPGSSTAAGEIWPVNASAGAPVTSGFASASVNRTYVYFHQYRATLGFQVLGGSGYTGSPTVNGTVFGSPVDLAVPGTYYLDAGTPYAFPAQLGGSSGSERWRGSSAATGTVSSVLDLNVAYYHQVLVTFNYRIVGTTAATPPQVQYAAVGVSTSATANATVWADSQSAYAYQDALTAPSSGIRWGPGANGNGTITTPATYSVTYREQFYLSVAVSPVSLSGSVTPSGWYDAGSTVSLSASAPSGWQFGSWSGDASGSTPGLSLPLRAPMNVTATFNAGLTLVAGPGGSVAYAYGSVSGTVPAGTSRTVYVPVGTAVTVTAQPSSWTQAFTGWSGIPGGMSGTATVTVTAPVTASAAFGFDAVVAAGLALVAVLIVAGLIVALVVRRRRRRPPAP